MKTKKLTQEDVHFKFVDACKSGDLIEFKLLYNEYYLKPKTKFSSFLRIFNKKPILNLDNPKSVDSKTLLVSAFTGQYNIVEEFLKDQKYVDILNENKILEQSMLGILSPKKLKLSPVEYSTFEKINNIMYEALQDKEYFHSQINLVFLDSCQNGDFHSVKYLLESQHLKKYLTFENNTIPTMFHLVKISNMEILNYLIIDKDMDKNDKFICKVLQTNSVLQTIEKKNLNSDLSCNLAMNENTSSVKKRNKI